MARRKGKPAVRPEELAPSLPEAFIVHARQWLGDEFDLFAKAMAEPAPTSIRLNPKKPFAAAEEQVPWCANGRFLRERPAFTLDPRLHAGAYYVQEASSMLLEQAVLASGMQGKNVLALDLCAAPGGKSTHLLSLLGSGSLLVSNEVVPSRRKILEENLWKNGAPNVLVSGSKPEELQQLPQVFDLVLVDAPCSGEGMFRKDPFAVRQWSPRLVEQCATVQREIVKNAWATLRPGGCLIYSTCTWEEAENEDQLKELICSGGESLEVKLDPSWGMLRTEKEGVLGLRCYPHRTKGEGFFISIMRKTGVVRERAPHGAAIEHPALPWLSSTASAYLLEHEGIRYACPTSWKKEVDLLRQNLDLHAPGIPFAERKGRDWVPHPAVALSSMLDRATLPNMALSELQALAYLSGEPLSAVNATGMVLVSFGEHALGWAQGAGNRWNNRWPAPWRIRSQRSTLPRVSW